MKTQDHNRKGLVYASKLNVSVGFLITNSSCILSMICEYEINCDRRRVNVKGPIAEMRRKMRIRKEKSVFHNWYSIVL